MIYLNDIPINVTMFPDGTSQIWKIAEEQLNTARKVIWKFESEGEFIHLAQLVRLIDMTSKRRLILYITYLPYARQDKPISNNACFALEIFANLLNDLGFEEVYITDPHSDRALYLIENSCPIYPVERVRNLYELLKVERVCYPDEGASRKYASQFRLPSIQAIKKRDADTGKIIYLKFEEYHGFIKDKSILIIDDICDGGMTFVLLAKALKELDVGEIFLFVTHGIFSNGTRHLFEAGISRIFTNDAEIGPRYGDQLI